MIQLDQITPICLGTADLGVKNTPEAALDLMTEYRAAGGNFLDTAHCYAAWVENGAGVPEQVVGEIVRRTDRDGWFIATKGGHPGFPHYSRPDQYAAPERVEADWTESQARMGLESVDLYYLHRDDPRVPVGELMDVLTSFVIRGRARYVGVSNWRAERVIEALRWCDANQRPQPTFWQNQGSLAKTPWEPSDDPGTVRYFLPTDYLLGAAENLILCPYTATANGYFATRGAGGTSFHSELNAGRLRRVLALATQRGLDPGEIALAWLRAQPCRVVPIIGTTRRDTLAQAMAARAISLSPEEAAELVNDAN